MKRKTALTLALLLLFALPLAASPALAQNLNSPIGMWIQEGDTGTMLLYLSDYGNYLAWYSWLPQVESGTFTQQGAQLTFSQYEGPSSTWEFSVMGGWLNALQPDSGTTLTLQAFEARAPQALLGIWEGNIEGLGPFEMTLFDNSEFTEFFLDDMEEDEGIFLDNERVIAFSYPNGFSLQLSYQITGSGQGAEVSFYDSQTGEFAFGLWRPDESVQPGPEVTPQVSPAPGQPSGLVGYWRSMDPEDPNTLVFHEDGRFQLIYDEATDEAENPSGEYSVLGDTLTFTLQDGSVETVRFILMGDSLLLASANDLQNVLNYTRTGPPGEDGEPEGQIDPALAGTWAGLSFGSYFELTISPDASYSFLSLPDESQGHKGRVTVQGGLMNLEYAGGLSTYAFFIDEAGVLVMGDDPTTKLSGPLSREPLPAAPPSKMADPALVGVWGGLEGGNYVEHVFLADGSYQRFAPLEGEAQSGSFMASEGVLAILSPGGGARQASYEAGEDSLTITDTGQAPFEFIRMDGVMKR
mgnify:FL=1